MGQSTCFSMAPQLLCKGSTTSFQRQYYFSAKAIRLLEVEYSLIWLKKYIKMSVFCENIP